MSRSHARRSSPRPTGSCWGTIAPSGFSNCGLQIVDCRLFSICNLQSAIPSVAVGVFDAGDPHQLIPAVVALDVADGAGGRAHDDGVSARPAAEVADAAQKLALGDSGRGEEHVFAL